MRFGDIAVPESMGQVEFKKFMVYFDKVLKHRTKKKPETIYRAIGGTLPKNTRSEGDN